ICYEPDPEFSVKDFVISILYYIVTAVCILFVIPYLCDVSNTAYFFINTFALFLHARFYCRFFRYHLPRMRDVDYQRAFALFRRKFVMECREAIMAQDKSTMAENAPADERAFALFRQSFVTENREAIMAKNNSTVAENTLANETNSHETSDDKP
ncbi:MAG: hypothetical protein II180_00595, partial [Proteobacteria bacterium]|nr:hypothetical protein [Pseudomonadota bacterium]